MLVVEGLLTRELVVDRARSVELLGAGDVIRPWQEDASSFCASTWQALEPTQVAILDDRVVAAMAAYPRLVVALVERSLRRSRFMALEAAISNLIGIEKRVLLLLWQVAEKCGRVEQRGVVVGPGLTHELIAEMIGARRQTVTQAITALVAAGAIERRADGAWMLLEQPQPPAVAEARRLHGATSEPSGSTGDAA
jgi:CRP-like cAMP-binding protein